MTLYTQSFSTCHARLLTSSTPSAPLVWMNAHFEDPEAFILFCRQNGCPDFHLLLVDDLDWNSDLTPWPAKALFKGQPDFGGQADAYLAFAQSTLIPWAFTHVPHSSGTIAAGYSLGGLFSLYAITQTSLFTGAAAVSPSAWYPGLIPYLKEHPVSKGVKAVYLSLGDQEEKTRNPLMKTVRTSLESVEQILKEEKVECIFQMNPGNHFQESFQRCAKGLEWLLPLCIQ
ncbi:MAG: alpha/beta hydrolase [Ileibacterium sp.]|nr:alpha/beta hydrolase [Ileibacterium sp.]